MRDSGQSLVEYLVLVGIFCVAAVVVVNFFADKTSQICTQMGMS